MSDSNKRRCSRCNKVFKSRAGCQMHIDEVHKGEGERIAVAKVPVREESMACLFVEAEMNRSMGLPNEDWIEAMMW